MKKIHPTIPIYSNVAHEGKNDGTDSARSSVSSDLDFNTTTQSNTEAVQVKYASTSHSHFRNELKAKIIKEVMDEILPDIGAYDIDGTVEKQRIPKGLIIDYLKYFGLYPLSIHETVMNGDFHHLEKFIKRIMTKVEPEKNKNIFGCQKKDFYNPLLINQYDEKGRTALSLAVKIKNEEMVDMLIANKAIPDLYDETTGRTPIFFSVLNKSYGISRQLLQSGASVNMCDFQCITPLMLAAGANDFEHVEILCSNMAEVDAQDENGWTPLHYAARANAAQCCAVLLDWGAHRNTKDIKKRKAFDIAVFLKNGEATHVLEDLKTRLATALLDDLG